MFHVVEDLEEVRILLKEIIEEAGHRVLAFDGPEAYLEYAGSDRFEAPVAIITDLYMPQMTGFEMMEQVLALHPGIKFAVISGTPNITHPLRHTACMYLPKPFRPADIEAMLDNFIACEQGKSPSEIGCSALGDRGYFGVFGKICPKK